MLLCTVCCGAEKTEPLLPESATHFEQHIRPLLVQYCGDCHAPTDEDEESTEFLNAMTVEQMNRDRSTWGSVASQLHNRTMPPADEAQPSEQERLEIANWITNTLRASACDLGDYAGAVTIRRLNRDEYANTIEDLFGVRFPFENTFPVDGSGGEGFNNNGETLFLPAMLMERYFDAAEQVVTTCLQTPDLLIRFSPSDFLTPEKVSHQEQLKVTSSRQETFVPVTVFTEDQYRLTIKPQQAKQQGALIVLIDGIPVESLSSTQTKKDHHIKLNLSSGVHTIGFRVESDGDQWLLKQVVLKQKEQHPSPKHRRAHLRWLPEEIPASEEDRLRLAEDILRKFSSLAYRRPATKAEVEKLLSIYNASTEADEPYVVRIRQAFKAVLLNSSFLFRYETIPEHGMQPLNDYELATRLSYFLWGHAPDAELTNLATNGQLHKTDVLKAQTIRMMADAKFRKFSTYFVGQWLGTHEVARRVAPDTSKFKDQFTHELLLDMRAEPEEFFHYLLTENRSLLETFTADYTFLTKRLARHYGLEGAKNNNFQKVRTEGEQRGGLLGFGAVHLLTSYPNRTSPVLRGAWVLETLLGTPVPSPPPDVPELPKRKKNKDGKRMSLRQILAIHRESATCAACHDVIDPIGFGLDNYDVLGRWRTEESETKQPIDSTGILPSGESFQGPQELKAILLNKKHEFLTHLTRKMLGYALGRSLDDRDSCTINRIVEDLEQHNYQAQRMVIGIVLSPQFRMIQPADSAIPTAHQP